MKKKDLILIGGLLLVALLSWGAIRMYQGNRVMTMPASSKEASEETTQTLGSVEEKSPEETETEAVPEGSELTSTSPEPDQQAETVIEETTENTGVLDASRESSQAQGEEEPSENEEEKEASQGVYGVHIIARGEDMGLYPLTEDRVIEIGETNTLEIKDGEANMVHAECPDQLCVHMGAIKDHYGLIVCLPNEVIVEGVTLVPAKEEVQLDGIS